MPGVVYLLCAATAFACGCLLLRAWRTNGVRLLFWSALCFFGLAIENVLLHVDLVVFPEVNLYNAPAIFGLVSVGLLLYGLIWDAN